MRTLQVQLNGETIKVKAMKIGKLLWFHYKGETFAFEAPSVGEKRNRAGGPSGNAGEVLAPMPGKISKVLVKAGQAVQPQSVLVVMEAMKMEYTLKAGAAAEVKEVLCQEGEQVALGQLLVHLNLKGGSLG